MEAADVRLLCAGMGDEDRATQRASIHNLSPLPGFCKLQPISLLYVVSLILVSFPILVSWTPVGLASLVTIKAPSTSVPSDPQPLLPSPYTPSNAPESPSLPFYPISPNKTLPKLSGNCAVNFTNIIEVLDRTARDCVAPFALYLGNVICCPQFKSLISIFQGEYSFESGSLALNMTGSDSCFSDILHILDSQGANNSIPTLCLAQPANLTGGSCPVKKKDEFEKTINVTKLLVHCKKVDPLKECCNPNCQPAVTEAARHLAAISPDFVGAEDGMMTSSQQQMVDDCEEIVLAWLSSQLGQKVANTVLRNLISCTVNKGCPLAFNDPSNVVGNCKGSSLPNITCCDSLSKYLSSIQQQSLLTNLQALDCANLLGSLLQRRGVTSNIYNLCHVYLKDFTLQTFGSEGCLLRSLPSDVLEDRSSGISFTCDLNDNIAAPWPPLSTSTSFSFCLPEVSMPAIPGNEVSGWMGYSRISTLLICTSIFILVVLQL